MSKQQGRISIGEQYGKWKVLARDKQSKTWVCECQCENKTRLNLDGSRILSGKESSCKFCRQTVKYIIKPGEVHNNWKVIEWQPGKKGSSGRWLCECIGCDKKNTRRLDARDLILNTRISCGCKQREATNKTFAEKYGCHPRKTSIVKDKARKTCLEKYGVENYSKTDESRKQSSEKQISIKIGTVYGFWEVLEHTSRAKWKCKCLNCGNIKENVRTSDLKNGKTRSCGCKRIELAQDTCIQSYGVSHMRKLPEKRRLLADWCENNPDKLFCSAPEKEMLAWLQQFYPEAKKFKKKYELDIYIEELKLGIEHNGTYRHSELFKSNDYHWKKTKHFEEMNIRTIHIWGHEWLSRQGQVKSFLLSAIGKNEHKIGARKCKIIWSEAKENCNIAQDFIEKYHIQGKTNGVKYVALAYKDEDLLAVATFGRHHRGKEEWVLSRFCTKTNWTIQGILSKFSKLACKNLNSDIISWADYRLTSGNGYLKAGWIKERVLKPDYNYVKIGTEYKIVSKQSRQKRIVETPQNMTESEHAKLDNLVKFYDCGKIRFRFKL